MPAVPDQFWLLLGDFLDKYGSNPYLRLGGVLILIFIFIVLLGYVREHIFKISMKGAMFGFVAGIVLVIIFDLMIVAALADKKTWEKVTSNENRQLIIQDVFISGFSNMGKVLGMTTVATSKKVTNAEEFVTSYLSLPQKDAQKVKDLLCPQ